MKQELFNNKTKAEDYQRQPKQLGLYEASHEHDACGVGMLVNIQGGKSHELVESALKVLENMRHRGAEGADNKTGDGAGIMLQIPHEFILLQGIPVPEKGKYGTGLLFLPKDGKDQAVILSVIIEEIEKEGLTLMHLRNVPTCPEILGEAALANEPDIKQIFITGFTESETADRKLYIIRKKDREQNTQVGHPHPRGFLHRLALYEEHRLQGDALFLAVAQLLPRPHQQLLHQRAGIGALPFQHQHFPHLGTGTTFPPAGTQRRNQYHPRQPRLDGSP